MSLAQAAYATVHEYEGGVEALAQGTGFKSKQVLINKANTNPDKSHHLTLAEVERIIKFTGDLRIIHAFADEVGGVFVPSPIGGSAGPLNVVNDISKMSQEFGTLIREVAEDIADGIITENEYKRIEAEANKLRVALAVLVSDLAAMQSSKVRQAA